MIRIFHLQSFIPRTTLNSTYLKRYFQNYSKLQNYLTITKTISNKPDQNRCVLTYVDIHIHTLNRSTIYIHPAINGLSCCCCSMDKISWLYLTAIDSNPDTTYK